MKKAGLLLAGVTAGIWLAGCQSSEKAAFSPSVSCVYVAEDGSLSSALVEEAGSTAVEEKELLQYLETAVSRFNEEKGAEAQAKNKKGKERLPVALQSLSLGDNNRVTVIFEYGSLEDMTAFGQTGDNEDATVSGISALEIKPVDEAETAGWFQDTVFVTADGSQANPEAAGQETGGKAVRIQGGTNLMVPGSILYRSGNTELIDEYTVSLPEDGTACVVFK